MDPVTKIALDILLLTQTAQKIEVDREVELFCFAFSGSDPDVCADWTSQRKNELIQGGFIKVIDSKFSISVKGKGALADLLNRMDKELTQLDGAIIRALSDIAGKQQASVFQGRLDALCEQADRLLKVEAIRPALECIFAVLVFRMKQHLKSPADSRTKNVRDLLDLAYSRVAVVKSRHENPDAEKKPDPKRIKWEKIERGLFHARHQLWLRDGPLHLNILRVNPKTRTLRALDCSTFEPNRRSLVQLCKENSAIAGTSGGYFLYSESDIAPPSRRGDPVGLIVSEGIVTNPPVYARSALLIDHKKQLFIRQIGMKGMAINAGAAKFIARKVNNTMGPSEIGVFTRAFTKTTPKVGTLHFTVVGARIHEVSETPLDIPLNGFGVVVHPGKAELGHFARIEPGDPVEYKLPKIKGVGDVMQAMAGGPALLLRKRVVLDYESEQFGPGLPPVTFSEDSSVGQALLPRMVWGITEHHELIACAVDGRNFQRSVGMTLDQIARFMMHLGCVDVLNFDGGSSKRMVVSGETVDLSTTGIVVDSQPKPPKRLLSSALLIR
jgi:hypothetical protein